MWSFLVENDKINILKQDILKLESFFNVIL